MRQLIQNYKTGELLIEEVAYPLSQRGACIVKTTNSLISAGTERTKIETANMNLLEKAFSRLDLVKTVLNNIKQEGLIFTFKKAFNKLNTPITLGYSCSGVIVELCQTMQSDYIIGDRVACIGEIYASHSDYNVVPSKWMTKIPDNVLNEEAAFVGVGAIALNSVELAQVNKGEKIVVIGLGLLGQIVIQILKARGAEVLGIEIDNQKIEVAKTLGIKHCINPLEDDVISSVNSFTDNIGADAVIITAASRNSFPLELAGKISRNKARVILVGAMPIVIPRDEFYNKEIIFLISRGFGSDIYNKENNNRNYCFAYKPYSMKENMDNFLNLVSNKMVNVKSLITHKFNLDEASSAYQVIFENKEKYLGIIFNYEEKENRDNIIHSQTKNIKQSNINFNKHVNVGFIGAGSFAQGYILPYLKSRNDVNLVGVATSKGVTSSNVSKKFGFSYSTSDYHEILKDSNIDTVFIATRHNMHADMVIHALEYGKNVFVEKPLCLNFEELERLKEAHIKNNKIVMVGFNRRFSPFIQKSKDFFLNRVGPMMLTYRVNAGFLPSNHWLNNEEGGGRILGEGCHFIDLMNFLVGVNYKSINVSSCTNSDENFNVTITYEDGSIANIQYSSVGDVSYSRERLEIFCENSAVVVDNYKKGDYSRNAIVKKLKKFERDMGHFNEVNFFIDALKNNKSLIEFDDLINTTEMTLKINEMIKG